MKKCCRGKIRFYCEACGSEKEVNWTCGIRICKKCMHKRKYRFEKKYKKLFKSMKYPQMLTLTFKGHHKLSKEIKSRLYKYAREFFRRTGMDGVRVLEIIRKPDGYFYHLHCIVDVRFYPYSKIKKIWYDVTGTSYITKMDKIKSDVGLWYITKYVSKPMNWIDLEAYIDFFYKCRMVTKFGKYYNWKFKKERTYGVICKECGSPMLYMGTFWEIVIKETKTDVDLQMTLKEIP